MSVSLYIQEPDSSPPAISDINSIKSSYNNSGNSTHPRRFITSDANYLEDLYLADVLPVGITNANGLMHVAEPTKYRLFVDQLTYTYHNDVIPINLPAEESASSQLRNIIVTLGTSRETISLQGVLVDRLTPTPSGGFTPLTKHIFLNIIRRQWARTITDTGNPLAYLRLTLDGNSTEDYSQDGWGSFSQDGRFSGFPKYYRGLIMNLTLTLQGGRPDIWNWRMEFAVIKNENFYQNPTS